MYKVGFLLQTDPRVAVKLRVHMIAYMCLFRIELPREVRGALQDQIEAGDVYPFCVQFRGLWLFFHVPLLFIEDLSLEVVDD